MGDHMLCQVRTDGEIVTVRPVGALNLRTAPTLRSVLHKAVAEGPTAIIISLADVDVLDDSCLTLFPAIAKHAADESQIEVLLCAASDTVTESLHRLGFDVSMPVYPTAEDAVRIAHAQPATRTGLRLASTPEAPALVRSLVDESCAQWQVSGDVAEALRLICTELVTNVIIHARTPMHVILRRSRRHIHVAVIDEEPSLATLRPPASPQSPTGRGLIFVEAFSSAWGCTPTASGKSTWATVPYQAPRTTAGTAHAAV